MEQREIKYRGWDLVHEQMLDVEAINFRENWISLNEGDNSLTDEFDMIILMQFTGLLDKNEKEIYEGDIVKYDNNQFSDLIEFHAPSFVRRCNDYSLRIIV